MRALAIVVALVVVGGGCRNRPSPEEPEIAEKVVGGDAYPRRRITFPDGVVGEPAVAYSSERGYRPLELDLYLPAPTPPGELARPFVVYVHGGGWVGGTRQMTGAFVDWPSVLASLAAKGYVVASVDYRLASEAPFPAPLHDVKTAIRFLRSHAKDFGIDKKRGIVWGSSAGGQLAALTAVSCGIAELSPNPSPPGTQATAEGEVSRPPRVESDCMQGAVIWYGVSDLGSLEGAESVPFIQCPQPDCDLTSVQRAASPVTHVDAGDPPFLLIHGVEDETVASQQSQEFADVLERHDVPCELVLLPGVGHSFIGRTPRATRDASRDALTRTFAFIARVTGTERRP